MGEPVYPVSAEWAAKAKFDRERYQRMYRESIEDSDAFWRREAQRIDWIKPFTEVSKTSFRKEDFGIRWFYDGTLNVSANCLDRHLEKHGDDIAIIWEPDGKDEAGRKITYRELHAEVCRFANGLKSLGVGRGDRVIIYMPMIPEAAVAMLACARIGAVHSVVFGGFSPDSLANRIVDCGGKLVVTADEGLRAGRPIPLKKNVDDALTRPGTDTVEHVVVVRRTGGKVPASARDIDYHTLTDGQSTDCPPEEMNAEDPLFILYTSGSTGKPKGVLHTTGGYLVWTSLTHEALFDYHRGDVYWCTADVGWVTGHAYVLHGPLANGATTLMYEGVPTYPDPGRFWDIVDKYQVSILYTAPTALRALMREGSEWVKKYARTSLRVLGSVGEPINPEAWQWYHDVVGDRRCPIIDTWWQTETGGIMIAAFPGATPLKPGAATWPFFGIEPVVVDTDGHRLEGVAEGGLCMARSWPGQMRTVWGDHERFFNTYFSTYPGLYFSADGCRRDADGDYWITGRIDDVINVSGHRLGTAEVESALVAHPKVAEAAVVGMPHDIKGQAIYAFVTLNAGEQGSDALTQELTRWVRKEIGPIAAPEIIQYAPGLPKTRSAKIMRRILRKIAENDPEHIGDTSTLADPSVVDELVATHRTLVAPAP